MKKRIFSFAPLLMLCAALLPAKAAETPTGEQTVTLTAGLGHSTAIKTDGSLWAWGSNSHGATGDGTAESRPSPVKIYDEVYYD